MSKSVIVYGQNYVVSGDGTQEVSTEFPGDNVAIHMFEIQPGSIAIDCKAPEAKCQEETKEYKNIRYTRVKVTDSKSGEQHVGWMMVKNLKPNGEVSLPVTTQASKCIACEQKAAREAIEQSSIVKHDAERKSILAEAKKSPRANFDSRCGNPKKSVGENLWVKINNNRRPDASSKCELQSKLCKHDKKSSACEVAKKSCFEATAVCRKVVGEFKAKCDIFAGLDIKDRIRNVITRIDPVLKALPAAYHAPILSKELIMCIMRREEPDFYPSEPSGRACYEKNADDFGLAQIKKGSMDYYWDYYRLSRSDSSTELPELKKYGTSKNLYFGMAENIDAEIELMALFLNAKYQTGIGRGDGKDRRGKPLPDGCDRVKDAVPITAAQRANDLLHGRPPMLRKTIRWYDNCGAGNYPNVIFSCMDKLKGKSEDELVDLLTPGNKTMSGGK